MNPDFDYALEQDRKDLLASYRSRFHIPKTEKGEDTIYFCGNSLGLMPVTAESYVMQELEDWKIHGVEGHTRARNPWVSYHELLTHPMAEVVGALPHEVVVMNSLTVNLHLLMVSFYRPDRGRYKILIDYLINVIFLTCVNPFTSNL